MDITVSPKFMTQTEPSQWRRSQPGWTILKLENLILCPRTFPEPTNLGACLVNLINLVEKPAWMDNPKARKLDSLPENFPRTYQSWGMPGQLNQSGEKFRTKWGIFITFVVNW